MAQATFRAEPSINALVVEDDYDLAELIKLDLSKWVSCVNMVSRGDDAIAFLAKNPVDLVLLDVLLAAGEKPPVLPLKNRHL